MSRLKRNTWAFAMMAVLGMSAPAIAQEEPAEEEQVEVTDDTDLDKEVAERGQDLGKEGMKEEDKGIGARGIEVPEDASPEFKEAYTAYGEAVTRYAAEVKDFQATVGAVVEAEYKRKAAEINEKFDARIRAQEVVERRRRVDAIAAFESFLERYPREPRYSPDAKFRLAELYFEKANDDYLLADEQYQVQMAAYEAGQVPDPPAEPIRDYGKTMQTFESLIAEWPDYRLLDGAYYLLAYCHLQMGDDQKARALFAELIVRRPDSEFVPEAWIRIGEYHFEYNELELAKQSYLEAMKFPDSKFFDKALYKLAWTYYRQDNFDQAIKEFKRLVEYSDDLERRTGQSGSVLRAEAVQYIAISLAEEDWNLDGVKDDDFGIMRAKRYLPGEKPYEREVLSQLGEYLFENTRYADSVDVYRYMLAKYPFDRDNPESHEKIILAMLRDDNLDGAFEERGKLNSFYGPKSEWYAYQQKVGNAEAIRYSDNMVRDNLIQSATWYHSEAQKTRNEAQGREDQELMGSAMDKYAIAARGYRDFLQRYPNDKDFYQWNFYYAECLYYSGQYKPAFEQYRVVREMDVPNNQYQETAAFNAVKSLEFLIGNEIKNGKLPSKVLPNLEEARETAKNQETARDEEEIERSDQKRVVSAEPIPPMVMDYITAMDRYVVLGLKNEEDKYLDAKFAFQAGKVFFDFKDYPTARKRFEWVINKYPDNEVAYLAGSLILETYRDENDFTGLAAAAEKLSNVIQGEQAEAIRQEVREFKLGALFKSAEQLFAEKKYEAAAEEYVRLLKEDPDTKYAAKALNNAAVAYENVKRYESAMKLYERVYKEHPKDPLAPYGLYRVAVNQERFFDFDEAVQSYELFYDKYERKDPAEVLAVVPDFDLTKKRGDALKSAAVLRENLQDYDGAAKGYEAYVAAYPSSKEASDVSWQAVLAWEKAGKKSKKTKAINNFISDYGSQSKNDARVLEGLMKIADDYEKANSRRNADKYYKRIISEYKARGQGPGSPAAFYAAKAQFMLAERQFEEWDRVKIRGNMKKQGKLLKQKIEGQKKLTVAYEDVWTYQSLEWTMASSYRIGSLYQGFARSLYEVPIPFSEESEQYDIYRTQLEDIAIPLEDEAIVRYEKTIAKAREAKIVNEWTKRTLEQLNTYKPADYPLFKEERQEVQNKNVSGLNFVTPEDLRTQPEEEAKP